MAKGKKSFITYLDWGDTFDALPDDKAGQLIKHVFAYVRDENPQAPDVLIEATFAGIKADLKRDLKKWEAYIEKQTVNGKKGGRPKKTQKTQPFSKKPKKADNVNVNVNVNENVTTSDDVVYTSTTLISIQDLKNELLQDEIWREAAAINLKVAPAKIEGEINRFIDHLTVSGEVTKSLKDGKSHFINWMRKGGRAAQPKFDMSDPNAYQ